MDLAEYIDSKGRDDLDADDVRDGLIDALLVRSLEAGDIALPVPEQEEEEEAAPPPPPRPAAKRKR